MISEIPSVCTVNLLVASWSFHTASHWLGELLTLAQWSYLWFDAHAIFLLLSLVVYNNPLNT
jgi:hypothetical protein